jgi:uncharacterized membrane protein (DUF106 family)
MSLSITAIPVSTFIILAISLGIAFLNVGINRTLIDRFVGWEQYKVMQKETNEFRAEQMKAMRANDKKQLEKLKKKEAQVKSMQAKMAKPQLVQFGISFLYIFVWLFVLTPVFDGTVMAYLPGIGTIANAHMVGSTVSIPNAISVIYWYPMCSFFLGLLASRIIGIMPIE